MSEAEAKGSAQPGAGPGRCSAGWGVSSRAPGRISSVQTRRKGWEERKLPHGQIAEQPREAGHRRETCHWSGWKIRVALRAALHALHSCRGYEQIKKKKLQKKKAQPSQENTQRWWPQSHTKKSLGRGALVRKKYFQLPVSP